jgi:hypothetical protein
MKIKKGFVMREVGGENVVVPTGKACAEFKGMIRLNGTAAFAWAFFKDEHTIEEAVAALIAAYDVDEATATKDIQKFVAILEKNGLIEKTEK